MVNCEKKEEYSRRIEPDVHRRPENGLPPSAADYQVEGDKELIDRGMHSSRVAGPAAKPEPFSGEHAGDAFDLLLMAETPPNPTNRSGKQNFEPHDNADHRS